MRSLLPGVAAFAIASAACGRTEDSVARTRPSDPGRDAASGAGARNSEAGVSSGGTVGAGGAHSSSGGVAAGGSGDGATSGGTGSGGGPPCSSPASECPGDYQLNSMILPACCTGADTCGYDTTGLQPYHDVAGGCQALGQPGMRVPGCPTSEFNGATQSHCCRFDGTCGTDLFEYGLGCVASNGSGTRAPCELTGTCRLVVQLTTVTANGRFAPHNVGAIWIEDASGRFVRTLSTWGTMRLSSALAWMQASGGNTVDAVTGATRGHGPLMAAWNCLDAAGAAVESGKYQLCMTFVEEPRIPFFDSGPMATLCVPLDLGDAPFDITFPADPHFQNLRVTKY